LHSVRRLRRERRANLVRTELASNSRGRPFFYWRLLALDGWKAHYLKSR